MLVSPINNNNNNFTFQAINEKYYNQALKEMKWAGGRVTGHFINCIGDDVILFKTISPQDGVDTLKAVRALIDKKKYKSTVDWINEILGHFNYLAKQERIEQRRLLKKELKKMKHK